MRVATVDDGHSEKGEKNSLNRANLLKFIRKQIGSVCRQ